MAAFSRKSSFATVAKFCNIIGSSLNLSLDLMYLSIILKNFTTVAKLLSLLNATNAASIEMSDNPKAPSRINTPCVGKFPSLNKKWFAE